MKTPLFAARLKKLRETVGLNQSEVARALGIKPQAVQKWESGLTAPRRPKLKSLASTLSTSASDLIRGTEMEEFPESAQRKNEESARVSTLRSSGAGIPHIRNGFIPLISWVQAVEWGQAMSNFKAGDAEDWIRCPFDHGPGAFILEVSGEGNYDPSGAKSYAPGEFIAVDPGRVPVNRSMVLLRIDHEERATLKQLLMDEGGTRLVKSLNPNWPGRVTPLPDGSRIIGVVIGKWVPE